MRYDTCFYRQQNKSQTVCWLFLYGEINSRHDLKGFHVTSINLQYVITCNSNIYCVATHLTIHDILRYTIRGQPICDMIHVSIDNKINHKPSAGCFYMENVMHYLYYSHADEQW